MATTTNLLTAAEAGRALGITAHAIRHAVRIGRLSPARNRPLLFTYEAVIAYGISRRGHEGRE